MNLTNAVAASNLRKMLRISESRAAALVEKIDIYDGKGRTTLANRGDGFVSSAEVSAFVAQVTALGGAGLTRTEQRSVSAFETMARYAKGEQIEPWVVNTDRFFDKSNAKQLIADAY